jgi:type VI secretion system protein ImpL
LKVIDAAQEEVSKDWVCPNAPAEKDQKVDKSRLAAKYANQYIDAWRKFLRNVKVREYNGADDATTMLYELSKDDSQLAQVMKEVERQTNISRSTESFWSKINIFSRKAAGGKEDIPSSVKRAFQPVIGFVAGEGDQSGGKLKQYLNGLTQARDALDEAKAGDSDGLRRFLNDTKGGLPKIESQMRPAITEMNKTTGGTEAAKVLVQPLDNLKNLLARENADQIENKWVNELYDMARQLEQRYPFVDSTNEASLTDVGRFFNPADGKFWVFFNENLKPSFELVQGEWRLKESGRNLRVSDAFLNYLNAAQRLTAALFPDGTKNAVLDFQLMVQPSAGATVEIQVNGKWLDATTLQPVKSTDSGGAIRVSQGFTQSPFNAYQGYWWPLRMIERGGGRRSGDGYKLSFKVASVTANATLKPTSAASDPFDRTMFRLLQRAPQHVR